MGGGRGRDRLLVKLIDKKEDGSQPANLRSSKAACKNMLEL